MFDLASLKPGDSILPSSELVDHGGSRYMGFANGTILATLGMYKGHYRLVIECRNGLIPSFTDSRFRGRFVPGNGDSTPLMRHLIHYRLRWPNRRAAVQGYTAFAALPLNTTAREVLAEVSLRNRANYAAFPPNRAMLEIRLASPGELASPQAAIRAYKALLRYETRWTLKYYLQCNDLTASAMALLTFD